MPRTVLGLPNKNLDLGVWQPAERADLVTVLRTKAAGPLAGEKQVTTFIRALDEAGVDQAGKELGALQQLKANTTGTAPAHLDSAISAKNTELAQKLQQAINQTSTQTPLKVVLNAGLPANVKGGYQPGFGELVLNEGLFHKGLTAESVDYTAHELTHFDLDVIRLRAAIERHGNAGDTSGITKAYGHLLGPKFLNNVLTLSSGKPLEVAQLQRLQEVDQSVKDYESGPGTTDIMRVDKLFKKVSAEFGKASPARIAQLKGTVNNLYTIRNTATDRYIGAQFESEAWATGVLAHIKARALGLPEASQDPSIFSH